MCVYPTQATTAVGGGLTSKPPVHFIPVPWSERPKGTKPLFSYHKWWISLIFQRFLTRFYMKWQSMPTLFSKPRVRNNHRLALATAKNHYRRMNEAIAAGDEQTLQDICIPRLVTKLKNDYSFGRRPAGEDMIWELVRSNRTWLYPRIVTSFYDFNTYRHELTAAMDLTQRLYKVDRRTGKQIPGSSKEVSRVEYITMLRTFDKNTYAASDWKVLRLPTPTDFKRFEDTMNIMDSQKNMKVMEKIEQKVPAHTLKK